MAKKHGSISKEEKHDERSKASLCLLEKQLQIKSYRKGKKTYSIKTKKGIITTTDPEKWKQYV